MIPKTTKNEITVTKADQKRNVQTVHLNTVNNSKLDRQYTNAGTPLKYNTRDICRYLLKTYGKGK